MKRTLMIALCLLRLVLAQPGPNDKVLKGAGPLGAWVSNGHWTLRVNQVRSITTLDQYRALAWKTPPNASHLSYLEQRVFGRDQRVVLIDLEITYPGSGSKSLGRARPSWRLRSTQAQQVGLSNSHQSEAMDWLRQGMALETNVPAGKAVRSTMVFFLPRASQPTDLFFNSLRHSHDGESESLVLRLTSPSAPANSTWKIPPLPCPDDPMPGGSLHPHKGSGPAGSWVSNDHWRMRLAGKAALETMSEYEALPWSERFSAKEREKHFRYVGSKVFAARQRVWLLEVQAHNLTDQKLSFGQAQPTWNLQTDLPKPFGAGLHHQAVAMWNLRQGMPRQDLVNAGQGSKGLLVFFLPAGCQPQRLSFTTLRHSPHGESGSLILNI